jgi:hypothetical protein
MKWCHLLFDSSTDKFYYGDENSLLFGLHSILKENKLGLQTNHVVCDTPVKLSLELCVIGGHHNLILIFLTQ